MSSAPQFQSALSAAGPGETILLKPGSYGKLTITKGGSPASPVYVAAQNPAVDVHAAPATVARSAVDQVTVKAGNVVLCGLYFTNKSAHSATHGGPLANVSYLQNYFDTATMTGGYIEGSITTAGGTNLVVQSNYFNATDSPTYSLDYGMMIFGPWNGIYIRGNVFDGIYNHPVSLKHNDSNVLIDGNIFKGCGLMCLILGQQQDYDGREMSGGAVTVRNNTFIEAYTTHPVARSRKGIIARNQEMITIENNTFKGVWQDTILTDFMNRGGIAKVADRLLGIWGRRQTHVVIQGNKFSGAKLRFSGRGTGHADLIEVKGNTGSFTCTIQPWSEAEGKKYVMSTIDPAAPTVTGCH